MIPSNRSEITGFTDGISSTLKAACRGENAVQSAVELVRWP